MNKKRATFDWQLLPLRRSLLWLFGNWYSLLYYKGKDLKKSYIYSNHIPSISIQSHFHSQTHIAGATPYRTYKTTN